MDEKLLSNNRKLAWWLLLTWGLFGATFLLLSRNNMHPLHPFLGLCAILGFISGAMAWNRRKATKTVLASALMIFFFLIILYWGGVIWKFLSVDPKRTIGDAFYQIYQLTFLGLAVGIREGFALSSFATFYREFLMPILQLITMGMLIRSK